MRNRAILGEFDGRRANVLLRKELGRECSVEELEDDLLPGIC
jgi:hypothetical protein